CAAERPAPSCSRALRCLRACPPPWPPIAVTSSPCACSSSRMRARTATSRSATGRTSERALLASSGVNVSSAIEPHRREERTRLAAWLALIAFFIAVQYVGRASGAEESDPLYKWSFAIGTGIQEALFLGIVLAIAGFSKERLALRIPERKARAAGLAIATIFIIQAFELL